jgi:hypothetical protein
MLHSKRDSYNTHYQICAARNAKRAARGQVCETTNRD